MGLLDIVNTTVRFGGHTAVDDVTIEVERGAITGLIGPNGAGKTTMFNVISGLQDPTEGRVLLDGKDVTKLSPHKRSRRGLGRTFQRLEVFTSLSVRDNLRVSGEIRNGWAHDHIDVETFVDRTVELLGLAGVAELNVAAIPTGQARLVELGRALMTTPKILLLDEPASGQTEQETEDFAAVLRSLIGEGITIFVVEHDMSLVMAVCDYIHVLDFGQLIASGTPAEVQTDQAVLDAYLGSEDVA